jgi:hypothetical protein
MAAVSLFSLMSVWPLMLLMGEFDDAAPWLVAFGILSSCASLQASDRLSKTHWIFLIPWVLSMILGMLYASFMLFVLIFSNNNFSF